MTRTSVGTTEAWRNALFRKANGWRLQKGRGDAIQLTGTGGTDRGPSLRRICPALADLLSTFLPLLLGRDRA